MSYRSFTFTRNNYSNTEFEDNLQCRYIVYGKEIGEKEGTPHLQGFVMFTNKRSLQAIRKLFKGCHVLPSYDSYSAMLYCKKGEQSSKEWKKFHENGPNYGKNADFTERGKPPMSRKQKGQKGKEYWENILKLAKAGDHDQIDAEIQIKFAKTLDYIYNKEQTKKRKYVDTEIKHEWYYGPTGTGKSRKARTENPEAYLKMCNKWWDHYQDEEVVLIEDFDKNHKVLCHHLKIWADRYPFLAEFKGGARKIRPKKIIVTSNYSPKDIWEEDQDLEPILRRFHIIHFNTPFVQ